jgi:predicted nucleic-acid-binding protein
VKLTPDTNVLVRMALADDPDQARIAAATLTAAEGIAVTLPALCEFVWVLRRGYKREAQAIAVAIRNLMSSATVRIDRPAVEAGLAILETGGDFADGVIAFEGSRLGGETFVSFDRDVVKRLKASGLRTLLL